MRNWRGQGLTVLVIAIIGMAAIATYAAQEVDGWRVGATAAMIAASATAAGGLIGFLFGIPPGSGW